jgi:hypothetical protein
MSDTTKGKPKKNTNIINQCKINDFNAMMKEASEAMDRVLMQRKKDLETWGEKEQSEFYEIFGSEGKRIIHVNLPVKGVKNIVEMTALDVMNDCVRRLIEIKATLTPESYLNKIYDPDTPNALTNYKFPDDYKGPKTFAAFVNSEQQKDYMINIGINFTGRKKNLGIRTCENVMGVGSRVATLCHEISHFEKKYSDSNLGGIGTGDYDDKGRRLEKGEQDRWSYEQHVEGANKLIKKKDEHVFDNAYNIEKYFQIEV